MKVLPTGDFEVEPSEDITFTVRRNDSPCNPGFDCHGWEDCGNVTRPDQNTCVKTCTAKSTSGAQSKCSVSVDFRNDAQGSFDTEDEYTVDIIGSSGGSFTSTFDPPPVLNGRTYQFTVK
jgi:hypothetical protein